MFQISVFFGLVTMAFSLVGWVVVSNKLNRHWDFGLATGASFILAIILGGGLFALLSAIRRRGSRPMICDKSLNDTATLLRDALIGPIAAFGGESEWVEDASSIKSKPDSSGTQILRFHSAIEDIDAESRRDFLGPRISAQFSLTVTLTDVGGNTSVEVYGSSLTGISTSLRNLVLDDARSIVRQSLKFD
jgi:hypothetical protein